MNQYQSCPVLKGTAREKLIGKYGSAVLVPFLSELIIFGVSFCIGMLFSVFTLAVSVMQPDAEASFGFFLASTLLTFICTVFGGVFNTGLSLFFLNIACQRRYSIADLFCGFRYHFKKSLCLSAATTAINTVCLLPFQWFQHCYEYTPSASCAMLMLLFLAIGLAVNIPVSLSLSQCFFLLLDFPQCSAGKLLSLSMRIMKGHRRRLFYLQLSFIPLLLLTVLSFGICSLWVTPYMYLSQALFFLDLMKPRQ